MRVGSPDAAAWPGDFGEPGQRGHDVRVLGHSDDLGSRTTVAIVPRPPLDIDPDWLRARFTMPGATALEIDGEIGHHPSTISSHARRLGIRMRAPWPDRSEFDEGLLRRRYVEDKAKISATAAEAGVSYDVVRKAIVRYGLTGRGVGRPQSG